MNRKSFPRRAELIIVALVIAGLGVMTKLASNERKAAHLCQLHLKQVGLATLQYVRDYDEKYPPATKWADVLPPYARNSSIFHCPRVGSNGYAMNKYLHQSTMARIKNPAGTPLIYDSTLEDKNAHDTGASWPAPSRHRKGNAIVFSDGHVAWLQQRPTFVPIPQPRPRKSRKY